MAGWRGIVYSATSGCFDLVGWCCQVTLSVTVGDSTACVTSACPIYMFPTSNTGSRKYYLWKKMIGWKIDLFFFITENLLGILDRLCAEPMCRSHDFLSLTLAVVGSTSSNCYFLLQCRCLWACVLCVLVVRFVKSEEGKSEEIWCILL